MRKLSKLTALVVTSLALGAGMISVVRAADLPDYPPTIEPPETPVFESAGGWYLRGDIGYKIYNDPSASLSNPAFGGGTFAGGRDQMTNEVMGDAFNVGIGAGYKFNDYLRGDLTLDYESPASVSGRLFCPTAGPACHGTGANAYSVESAKVTAYSALVNGYVDLGTYSGLTPYVGGGVGMSYLVTTDAHTVGGASYGGAGQTNFAWALMAGASYALNDQWSIDAGYRYINLGDAKTAEFTDGLGQSAHIDYSGIDAHEVRVGLRYNLY